MGYIGRDTFPLPSLGPVLWNLAQELYSGRGFFVIRTIPIDKYSKTELAIVYTGRCQLFGWLHMKVELDFYLF